MENTNPMHKNRQDASPKNSNGNYSEHERESHQRNVWNTTASNVELAEEDMNDPDLAMGNSSSHSYLLQPG